MPAARAAERPLKKCGVKQEKGIKHYHSININSDANTYRIAPLLLRVKLAAVVLMCRFQPAEIPRMDFGFAAISRYRFAKCVYCLIQLWPAHSNRCYCLVSHCCLCGLLRSLAFCFLKHKDSGFKLPRAYNTIVHIKKKIIYENHTMDKHGCLNVELQVEQNIDSSFNSILHQIIDLYSNYAIYSMN